MIETEYGAALHLVHKWMDAAGKGFDPQDDGGFHPQEETLQTWLALALVKSGYCEPPEVVAELTLGERGEGEDSRLLGNLARKWFPGVGTEGKYLRYDLAVLEGPPSNAVRSFGTCDPVPRLVIEVKALNSAGGLQRAAIIRDMRKLEVARQWWREVRKTEISTLMVVLATSAKVVSNQTTAEKVDRWVTGFGADASVPSGIPVALILAKESKLVQAERSDATAG